MSLPLGGPPAHPAQIERSGGLCSAERCAACLFLDFRASVSPVPDHVSGDHADRLQSPPSGCAQPDGWPFPGSERGGRPVVSAYWYPLQLWGSRILGWERDGLRRARPCSGPGGGWPSTRERASERSSWCRKVWTGGVGSPGLGVRFGLLREGPLVFLQKLTGRFYAQTPSFQMLTSTLFP